jgi:hypothetical protein
MLFKGNVSSDTEVVVECSAPLQNDPKPVLLTVAQVPAPDKPFVAPFHALVAPGGSVVLMSGDLEDAVGLRVDIDVPEPGTARVRVTQGSIECVQTTAVEQDEKWLFSVA